MISQHMKNASIIMFSSLLVCATLLGCAGSQSVKTAITPEMEGDAQSRKVNELILKKTMIEGAKSEDDYVIGSEDLLEIEVFQTEELRKTVRVSSQGYIGMPLTGQVKAKGLTPLQLEREIALRLEKYMEAPLVSVYVKEYRAQKIAVLGAVTVPQVHAVTGQRHLLDMLSMSGGLTKDAASICYILRPVSNTQPGASATETMVIDLNELLEKGDAALNVPVFGGDVINVPKGGMIFVDGAVERPGAFPLHGKTTLVQAIAMAGGMKFEADNADIKLYRDNGQGTREVISLDYAAIRKVEQNDFILKENDIIIVPKSGVKNFVSGFMNTIRGFVSFGRSL